MSVLTTKIQSIGSEAKLLKEEKMVILSGRDAPDTLADYCYSTEVQPTTEATTNKQTLVADEQTYQITAVGEIALTNLDTLGHVIIRFDGATTPELSGILYIGEKTIPEITVGTTVTILQSSFKGGT